MRRSNTANEETTPPKMTFCSLDCRNKGSFRTSELYLCLVLHSQGHFQGCPQELAFFLAELIKRAQHIWTADSAACVLSKENVPRESQSIHTFLEVEGGVGLKEMKEKCTSET